MILIALIIEQQDLQGCVITRHMEYGRILSLLCVFCPGTHISAAVKRVVVKFCVMIELCRGCALSPFSGDVSRGLQMLLWPLLDCFPHLTANIWKNVSQLRCNITRRELSKNALHGAVSPRGVSIRPNCCSFTILDCCQL